jgi:DNA-nicking Smr family endonuclease
LGKLFIKRKQLPNKDNLKKKYKEAKTKSLDLHGHTLDEANQVIENFIKKSFEDNSF